MIKLIEMDENVTLSAQMEENVGPVILINKFNVKPEDVDRLLKAWTADATYFKQQPGFISTELHRGIAGSCVFINYAVMGEVMLHYLVILFFSRYPPRSLSLSSYTLQVEQRPSNL